MGISIFSAVVNKRLSAVKYKKAKKSGKDIEKYPLWTMLEENNKIVLSRLQMFIFTWIGIIIFLATVFSMIFITNSSKFPEPDPSLVFLMGVSQAGYLGAKFATKTGNNDGGRNRI